MLQIAVRKGCAQLSGVGRRRRRRGASRWERASNSDGSDNVNQVEEDIQLRHKQERKERLKEPPLSEIIEEVEHQGRSEVVV